MKTSPYRKRCRFNAPWPLVEKTHISANGVLYICRSHSLVNRWNKALAVGLRHNHDLLFIVTQSKSLALIYYLTNYTTKVEDPVWKRVVAAGECLPVLDTDVGHGQSRDKAGADGAVTDVSDGARRNKTRQFLMRVANRIFTERPVLQVEVVAYLLGYPMEFSSAKSWTFLNTNRLYWIIFQHWPSLQEAVGMTADYSHADADAVLLDQAGRRLMPVEVYPYRGAVLRSLCLYDSMAFIQIRLMNSRLRADEIAIPLDPSCSVSESFVQQIRPSNAHVAVCFDGYLSIDFDDESESSGLYYRR